MLAVPRGVLVTILGLVAFVLWAIRAFLASGASAGAFCAHADDCRSGICMTHIGAGSCADPCTEDDDCPADRVCRHLVGARVCWPPADVDLGGRCVSDDECVRGTCMHNLAGRDLSGRCAARCRDGLCDDGFVCADDRCLTPEFLGLPPPRHHRAADGGARAP